MYKTLCALSFSVQNCSFGLKELPLYFQQCEGMKMLGKQRDLKFLPQSMPQEVPLVAFSVRRLEKGLCSDDSSAAGNKKTELKHFPGCKKKN